MRQRPLAFAALAAFAAFGSFSPTLGAQETDTGSTPRSTMSAADADLEARTSAVAATLRCPVCQGESIQDSPSQLAQQMRAVVRDRLRSGESPEQVKAYFVSKYGEWILLEPKMTGLNLLLYALPVILVVGGLVFVTLLVRRWTRPQAAVDTEQRTENANP